MTKFQVGDTVNILGSNSPGLVVFVSQARSSTGAYLVRVSGGDSVWKAGCNLSPRKIKVPEPEPEEPKETFRVIRGLNLLKDKFSSRAEADEFIKQKVRGAHKAEQFLVVKVEATYELEINLKETK